MASSLGRLTRSLARNLLPYLGVYIDVELWGYPETLKTARHRTAVWNQWRATRSAIITGWSSYAAGATAP